MIDYSKYIYWFFALLLVWFSYYSFDWAHTKWSYLGMVIYLAPLLSLVLKIRQGRYYIFVFSLFIAAQTAAPSLLRSDYFIVQPNFQKITVFEDEAVHGLSGRHHISVDERGFRITKPIDYEKKPEGFRIFAIGGSTTQMIYIDDRKTWTHLLQEKLSKDYHGNVEVINTGLAGTRAEQGLGTLKKIVKFHPDLAVFLVGTNDWRRHILNQVIGNSSGASPSYPWENFSFYNSLIGRVYSSVVLKRKRDAENRDKNQIETEIFLKNSESAHLKRARCDKGTDVNLPLDFPRHVSVAFEEALKGIKAMCEKNGLTCMLLTQPHGYKPGARGKFREELSCMNRWKAPEVPDGTEYVFRDVDRMGSIAEFYNNYTMHFARANHLLYCDVAAKVEPTNEMFFDEVHYTEQGSEKVADEVFKCVKRLLKK